MTSHDRRHFLKLSLGATGAALAAGVVPSSITKALSIPASRRTGTLADVEHVVILMQENRSFDHYFGSLGGVRGFGDTRTFTLASGRSVWHQPYPGSPDDYLLPFHPDAERLGLQFIEDLPHGWNDTHAAANGGKYDGWVQAKGTTTMAYLTREDIPFHYALADAFTICDAYHCSMLSSTDPNRYYMWSGYVGNDGQGAGPVLDNAEKGYHWTTYPERLEQAGVSWKIYQDIGTGLDAAGSWGWTPNPYIGNYGDNSLLYFDNYRNAQPGNPLYDKARTGTEIARGQSPFALLREDVMANRLPQVSWIAAPEAYTEHPSWPANYGAWYVDGVLDALTSNPDVWSKTALFITYDENDGFFDHIVPPYVPASRDQGLSTVSTEGELYAGGHGFVPGVYGLGVRVPMLVVSPWSTGGWVCSETYDHTSILRFLEARFGVREPNISAWRRAVCGDLTRAFDFSRHDGDAPRLPATGDYRPDQQKHDPLHPAPPAEQRMPKQEPGQRPSRALAYDVDVRGRVDTGAGKYGLEFINQGKAGAFFHVFSAARTDGPWTYTVEAGKSLADTWTSLYSGNAYDLSVTGPNGFLRRFAGSQPVPDPGPHAALEVHIAESELDGLLRLVIVNEGSRACIVTVNPSDDYTHQPSRRHVVLPGSRIESLWEILSSDHWYDMTVTSDHDPHFLRRLAGHRETGRPSRTDPALSSRR
ncbi:phosphocholine-specific phospholipase C [Luteibacter sp. UNCMF366Tsu5.1]|uniref:phosphocholine-specific phospholipase C n=1 Tax=Luteibacter sp. UNCMF366Tsu5.1 TaxID=1502758 RepID=UPI0009086DF6|nr:phospholipase C, phosphocholine-specific [Luteibacter sp. UNCMF366Tsu5.1]SFW25227.1 phospholipase C [Luteibacter sp. UNCMF366Tsu5.1]